MLEITIIGKDLWDEKNERFIIVAETRTIQLEHSLVSISKWESKWHKAYLGKKEKSHEEILDYIKCMTLTKNVDPNLYLCLSASNMKDIDEYIHDSMSATNVPQAKGGVGNKDTMTSELIYYYMIANNIPMECQKWHLNRLITLINVCAFKNNPPKSMSRGDVMRRNSALNAARKKQMNSRG